jgi:hypothetical protein
MTIRNPQSAIRNCLCATLLLLAVAGSVAAQGTQSGPLRKTDLIRLLASGRPPGNVALMVRRRCLAFTPSPRDRFDLAAAGADKELLDAIEGCASRATRAGGSAALRIVAPERLRATAGSEVTLTVRLLRGGVPQGGKSLQLRGATAIPGGALQEPGAVTNARGVATFRVLAGMQSGTYRLEITALGDQPAQVTVQLVTAAPTLLADVLPPVVVVREGSRVPALVRVVVRGAGGAPVAALPLELRGISAQLGPLPPVNSDGTGMALLPLPAGALRAGGTIGVFARACCSPPSPRASKRPRSRTTAPSSSRERASAATCTSRCGSRCCSRCATPRACRWPATPSASRPPTPRSRTPQRPPTPPAWRAPP